MFQNKKLKRNTTYAIAEVALCPPLLKEFFMANTYMFQWVSLDKFFASKSINFFEPS